MKLLPVFFFTFFFLFSVKVSAQDDLLELAQADDSAGTFFTTATFKATRIINGHSVETIPHKELLFLIQHRFGTLNSGIYNLFGLDQSTIRLGLEYGLTNRLAIGVGRSSLEKTYDNYLKYKLLRQQENSWTRPVTVTAFFSTAIKTLEFAEDEGSNEFSSRLSYTYQLLIARKFNQRFSLQLAPSLVHRNMVSLAKDQNDVYALGLGSRYKLTKRTSFNAEYFYIMPGETADTFKNALSLGFDIETGGHVFQLHVTNSQGMIEKFFIPQIRGTWGNGDIYFGFNISRAFDLSKQEKKDWQEKKE